jgi:hypothetical protein
MRPERNATASTRGRTFGAGPSGPGVLLPKQLARTPRNLTARLSVDSSNTSVRKLPYERLVNDRLIGRHAEDSIVELDPVHFLSFRIAY